MTARDAIPQLITVAAAARKLSTDPKQVYRLIERGDLPAVRLSERMMRIKESDLIAYIEGRITTRGELQARTMLLSVPIRATNHNNTRAGRVIPAKRKSNG